MKPDRSYAQPSPDANEVGNVEDNASAEDIAMRRSEALEKNTIAVNDEDREPIITSKDDVEDA